MRQCRRAAEQLAHFDLEFRDLVHKSRPQKTWGKETNRVQSKPGREDNMRKVMMVMLTVGAVTASSTPSFAAQSQHAQLFCYQGSHCVPTSQQSYNECFQLALQRGWNVSDNTRVARRLDWFIYQCLTGRIPR
jgi:hypothetical protein